MGKQSRAKAAAREARENQKQMIAHLRGQVIDGVSIGEYELMGRVLQMSPGAGNGEPKTLVAVLTKEDVAIRQPEDGKDRTQEIQIPEIGIAQEEPRIESGVENVEAETSHEPQEIFVAEASEGAIETLPDGSIKEYGITFSPEEQRLRQNRTNIDVLSATLPSLDRRQQELADRIREDSFNNTKTNPRIKEEILRSPDITADHIFVAAMQGLRDRPLAAWKERR